MCIRQILRRRSEKGFSLLEILLVLFLAPIVFFAVYSNFSTGVKLWQRLQIVLPEEDQIIFLHKVRSDFNSAMRYSVIPFEGSQEEVVFPSGIQDGLAPGQDRPIGRVRYFYDESARGLMREAADISECYQEKQGKIDRLLDGIGSFQIAYLVEDPDDQEYVWREDFRPQKPGDLPSAVKFSYFSQSSGKGVESTFFIPAGGAKK